MKLLRRQFPHLAAAAAALPSAIGAAWAQAYPVRPITMRLCRWLGLGPTAAEEIPVTTISFLEFKRFVVLPAAATIPPIRHDWAQAEITSLSDLHNLVATP